MTTLDPIIAVKDVEASSLWYQQVFLFTREHGGENFAVLKSPENQVILCLHQWEAHHHPTLTDPKIPIGNGLLLYFRTANMYQIYQNAIKAGCIMEEEVHLNPNSQQQEFSFRDPDGYFLTVSAYHEYEG